MSINAYICPAYLYICVCLKANHFFKTKRMSNGNNFISETLRKSDLHSSVVK